MIEIINREVKLRDICYRITSKGAICKLNNDELLKISSPFRELNKDISNIDDLRVASSNVREREKARVRTLKMQENGGYVLIGGLVCIGTLVTGIIIFETIKFLILK